MVSSLLEGFTKLKTPSLLSIKLYTSSILKNLLGIQFVKFLNPESIPILQSQVQPNKSTVLVGKYNSFLSLLMSLRSHFQINYHPLYNCLKILSSSIHSVKYLLDILQKFTIFLMLISFFYFFQLLLKNTCFEFFH
jgi:hypothetical protein